MIIVHWLLLALGFAMLIKGSDFFVDGSSGIAKRFGIPSIVIGLTIVAMGTSAPEAAVSIASSASGNPGIAIGNIIGSNILNILLILGITSVIVNIAVLKTTIKYEMPFMIGMTVLLLLLGLDGNITIVDAIIFLIALVLYMVYLFRLAKKGNQEEETHIKNLKTPIAIIFTVGGMLLIIFGSKITVDAATNIAKQFGVSDRIIGLTVVAFGTSLPELFTSITAAKKGNADLAIGNVVGSNIFNVIFILGISGLITPIPYAPNFRIDNIIAIAISVLLLLFVLKTKKLKKQAGITFLVIYAVYFIYLLIFTK